MKENEAGRQAELSREATLEAVLFAAGNPLPLASLAAIMDCEESEVVELARSLQAKLTSEGSGLTVQRVAGGYQLVTRPETYATVERLSQVTDRHLSAPTMETLSIIAFKQPIT
ncbi:MAG: SMC-Scp complex subunit ScpB, partial [Mitsuokella jalaludinii]|nr:SMC-Scp complex subunit ScpB [Mitsuokella jalaludinii]